MKRTTEKQLRLRVETVRALQPLDEKKLGAVAGGKPVPKPSSGNASCENP